MDRSSAAYVNRRKHNSILWTVCLLALMVVVSVLQFMPISRLITAKLLPSRSLLTAVKELAKENQARFFYSTAVRIDESFDPEQCKPQDPSLINLGENAVLAPNDIVTPVPTLTEFIISRQRQLVCVVVSEVRNADSPKDPEEFKTNTRREDYAAVYGDFPPMPMLPMTRDMYDLSKARLDLLVDSPERMPPTFKQFYGRVPRAYPITVQPASMELRFKENETFAIYLKTVRAELRRSDPVRWTISVLVVGLPILFLLFGLRPLFVLYYSFQREMRMLGVPFVSMKEFVFADDVAELREELLDRQKSGLREQNEQRENERRLARQQEQAARAAAVVLPTEETDEQRQTRRREKIAAMCRRLQDLTPNKDDAQRETEDICSRATTLVDSNFDAARELISRAIEERKLKNKEEGVG